MLSQLIKQFSVVVKVSNIVWVLDKDPAKLACLRPREICNFTNHEFNPVSEAARADNVQVLRENRLGDKELGPRGVVGCVCERDSLSATRSFVKEGRIRNIHAC